jgi:phage terminase small subunit
MKLTPKQDKFCQEYLIDLNATAAAIRAGYSEKTARQIGNRLLTNVDISEHIRRLRNVQAVKAGISAEYVLSGLKAVAERCMQAEPILDRDGEETGEYRFNAAGANKALELLGRHLGLFDGEQAQGDEVKAVKLPFIPKLKLDKNA